MTTLAEIKARHEIGIIDTDKLWLIADVERLRAIDAGLPLLVKDAHDQGMEAAAKIAEGVEVTLDADDPFGNHQIAAAIRAEIKT